MIWHRRTLLSLREPSLCSSYRHTLITSAASYCASATDWCKAWSLCSTTAARWSTPDPSLRHAAHFHSAALRSGLSHAGHSAARDNPVTVSNAANTLTHPTGVGRLQPWLRRRGSTPRWVAVGNAASSACHQRQTTVGAHCVRFPFNQAGTVAWCCRPSGLRADPGCRRACH